MCSVLLLVITALSWIAYDRVSHAVRETAAERLEVQTRQLAAMLAANAAQSVRAAEARANHPVLRSYLREPSDASLARLLSVLRRSETSSGQQPALELRDRRGLHLQWLIGDSIQFARMPAPDLLATVVGSDSGTVGALTGVGDTIVMPVIVTVRDGGERLGYLIEWHRLRGSASARQRRATDLMSGALMLLGSRDGVWTDQAAVFDPPATVVTSEETMRYQRPGYGPRMAKALPVAGTHWLILNELSEREVLAPARRFLRNFAYLAALMFLGAFAAVWLIMRRITWRLKQLTVAAESMSEGDYHRRVETSGGDEFARVGQSFNRMAERVQQTVTELSSTREQFAHAQRMEAVGRLAGGVAHHFNNLLTVILGEIDLATSGQSLDADTRETLESIRSAGERAGTLTRQLLTFSRRQLIEPTVFNVNELVLNLERMLTRLIGEDVELVTQVEARDPAVRADRSQIEQVLVNLAVNARDAMPKGGKLAIKTRNTVLAADSAEAGAGMAPGMYVMISVSDTGTGMSDEVKTHIFEPFFTTKRAGLGTGLGLATCYGIINQIAGHIAVDSQSGVGTTIRVYLPYAGGPIEPAIEPVLHLPGGHETILVVEDEEIVRRVAGRLLRAQGYNIIEAPDAETALTLLEQHAGKIDLLLTDVVLPKMGGRELADRAHQSWPELKVLFASGYTDDLLLQNQIVGGNVALVHKPYTRETLTQKIREVLTTQHR